MGFTTAIVGVSDAAGGGVTVLGHVLITDTVRPGAARALAELRRTGVAHTVMLTGDNSAAARAVAGAVGGIDEIRAELLPEDKMRVMRELRARYGRVAFVGDGINDAPALAAADVGIAMGAATDVALETADIALMSNDLAQLPLTMRFARNAEGIIRVNIAVALIAKAVFVALAIGGWATLWMAVAADMGASLLVILNGMRAMRPTLPWTR